MEKIKYIKSPSSFNQDNSFNVHIPFVNSEKELMNELNIRFDFPYFGFNWDGLYDLLRDFHWVDQRQIVLIHEDIPNLDSVSLKVYITVLIDSIDDWEIGEGHSLTVVFPEKSKSLIEECINEIQG